MPFTAFFHLPEKKRMSPRKVTLCKTINDKAKIICRSCCRNWYIPAPPGSNEKLVRCQCGVSTFIQLERRSHPREPICRIGSLIFPQNFELPVFLCDFSLGGIGFICSKRDSLLMTKGLNILLKYRSEEGSMIQRRICVRNSRGQQIGAEFIGLPLV
jgi:hypothetical protein